MSVRWRSPGAVMGTVDLRKLDGDQIVIHFGGNLTSVDAYTFANSLISFADTIRAVNEIINPGQSIEVRLDAVGPGSFRAVIKRVRKGLGGLFSSAPSSVFWMIVGAMIIDPYFDPESIIEIGDNAVIIHRGGDRIIITRDAFDQFQNVKDNPKVRRGVRQTFEAIERDESIENFGLTPNLEDEEPLLQIPREDFGRLSQLPEIVGDESKRRPQKNRAVIIVLKPWVDASKHKWSFEWNGVPMSAYVKDEGFIERVKNHEIRFGNGDALDITIEYFQDYDENLDVWINDTQSYLVTIVHSYIPKDGDRVDLL